MMKIIADESVDFTIVDILREEGIEVIAIVEDYASISDDMVLQFAFENDALLVTEDKDFGELAIRLKKPHRGILLIRLSGNSGEEKAAVVRGVIKENYEKLIDSFSVLNEKKLRIRSLKR